MHCECEMCSINASVIRGRGGEGRKGALWDGQLQETSHSSAMHLPESVSLASAFRGGGGGGSCSV